MKKLILVVTLLCACLAPLPAQEVDANLIDAVTLYSNGQYKQAQALLQTLGVAAPNNDAVWYYLALTSFQLRDLEGAASAVQKAVALDSTNYWYRRLQARTSLLRGQPEEGIAQYESIVKDFPDNSSAPYELLDLYLGNKQYQKALDVLEEIEQQHGLSEEIVRTRYDVYTAMGRQDEGAEQLEKFNAQYSLPSVLSMLGDYYLADYRDSLALERYKEALSLDSAYIPALLGESEVYRHMRRYPDYFNTLMPFFASEDIPAQSKSMYIGNLTRSLDPKIL